MPPDDDQLRAIGRITLLFNDLEHSLNLLVWRLINPNINIGRIVFEGENFDRMLRRARDLSEEVAREDQELGDAIRRWTNRAGDVKRRRNDVLHAQWAIDQPSGEIRGLRMLGGKAPRDVDISATALDRLAIDIHHVAVELGLIERRVL
jgi:hypothetical protein